MKAWAEREFGPLDGLAQGIAVSIVIGICAQFLSEHYGAPAMLMALLLGIAFHFLAEEGRCVAGINFTARTVLRMGVALLGARISVELLIGLGVELIGLVVLGVVATIAFAWLGARFLGRGWRFALLTGGSVAICGASAAMAIAAVGMKCSLKTIFDVGSQAIILIVAETVFIACFILGGLWYLQ